MAVIRVGIIGLGGISGEHIEAYQTFPERCHVAALADIVPAKCERQAERYGLDVPVFESHQQMLEATELDLVSVCTPPATHADITVNSLFAGNHVLVEKPMSPSLEECDEMVTAARTSGRLLSVVAQNRFRAPIMKLKRLLDQGAVGRVLHVQVDSYWWRSLSYYDLWWRGTWETEGGGCTFIHAVHHIDALQWMMGMPVEVRAMMANLAHTNSEVEDLSCAVMRFESGAIGQVTSSVVHHGQQQQLVFQAEKARVSYPWHVDATRGKENGFPERDSEAETELQRLFDELPGADHEGHVGQVDNVLSAIEGQGDVLVDGEQGRRTMEVILAIYKASITGEPVFLPVGVDDPFYRRHGLAVLAPRFYDKSASVKEFADSEISLMGEYR